MKNKKHTHCCWCGAALTPGVGTAFFVGEEDEMLGFGPMGATGWMAKCEEKEECRARVEEQNEKEKQRKAEEKKNKNLERSLFPEEIQYFGGFKEGGFCLSGIEYMTEEKGRNIYGGGEWYVDTGENIWKCINNGMDGDDWSQNNISTGGAGAIGYIYAKTQERMEFLKNHTINITEKRQREEEEANEEAKKLITKIGGVKWEVQTFKNLLMQ